MNERKVFNININPDNACSLALHEAQLTTAQFTSVLIEGGYWVVEFTDGAQDYVCYVDAEDGSVPGFSLTPSQDIVLSVEHNGSVRVEGAA